MTNTTRRVPQLVLIAAFAAVAAGLTATSLALAQGYRPFPTTKHPVGSEVVDLITPADVRGILTHIAVDSRGAILPNSLDGRAQYIINARRDVSEPERHAEWDDVMIVQSGYGYVEYSRSIKGGARYGQGEWRGGVLAPPLTTLELGPGVVVRIPAGVPHLIRPMGGAPLVYLVLKERVAGASPAAKTP